MQKLSPNLFDKTYFPLTTLLIPSKHFIQIKICLQTIMMEENERHVCMDKC